MSTAEITIVGGGIVGAAVALGLLLRGRDVLVLDAGDADPRASTANMGLVWVNGKGKRYPDYQRLTRRSALLWPELERQIMDVTGLSLDYVGQDELQMQADHLATLRREAPELPADTEIIDRHRLSELLPRVQLGQEVVGAAFCPADGHVNPLKLWRGLRAAILKLGGKLRTNTLVKQIEITGNTFQLHTALGAISTDKVLLAAGLGNRELAAQVGLEIPIRPERGQLLVTERLQPWLSLPGSGVRQTSDGTVMIGSSKEDAGLDRSVTAEQSIRMIRRAIRILPELENVRLVRQWAGLRVLSPDGVPIYARADAAPNLFVATCHSGVTLAAGHAIDLAEAIDQGDSTGLPLDLFQSFTEKRFHVSQAIA